MVWQNDDGLNVRFGLEKSEVGKGGELPSVGDEIEVRIKITGTDVPAADAPVETVPEAGLPTGSYITSAVLHVTTPFTSGGAATLDIGLFHDDGDGTYSVYDLDGIDAAIAITAIDGDGDQVASDGALVGSGAGALAGTGDRPVYVSTGWGTAAFTAGEGVLVLKIRK